MADYLQSLDPRSLLILETILSFSISPFSSPPYNLPIFLFGVYSQESSESNESLKLFTGMVGVSALFDIIWMIRGDQSWFTKLVTIIILLLKGPTFLAFLSALRQRGEQFSGLGIRGGDLTGPTVWSMPGGFSSLGRNGYENVDGGDVESHPRPPAPPIVPVQAKNVTPPHVQAPASAPGAVRDSHQPPANAGGYQTI